MPRGFSKGRSKKSNQTCQQVQWIGPSIDFEKTRNGATKTYYSAFESKGMKVAVGNFVKLHSPSSESLPYIGRVHAMWQMNSAPDAQFLKIGWFWRHQDTHLGKPCANAHPNEIFHSKDWDDNSVLSVIATVQVVAEDVPGSVTDGPFICRKSYNPASKRFLPYDFHAKTFGLKGRAMASDSVSNGPVKRGPLVRNTQRKESQPGDGLDVAHDSAFSKKTKRRKKAPAGSHAQHKDECQRTLVAKDQPFKRSDNLNSSVDATTSDLVKPATGITSPKFSCSSASTAAEKRKMKPRFEAESNDKRAKKPKANAPAFGSPEDNKALRELDRIVTVAAVDDYLSPCSDAKTPQKHQHRIGPDYQISRSEIEAISNQPCDTSVGKANVRWKPNPECVSNEDIRTYCNACRQLCQLLKRVEVGGVYPIWHKDKKQFKWAVLISRDPATVREEHQPDSNSIVAEESNSARAKAQSPNELLRRISKQQRSGLGAGRVELLNIRNKIIRIRLRRSPIHSSKSPTQRVDTDRLLEPVVVRFKGEKGTQIVTLGDFWVCSRQDLFLAALREHRFDAEKALETVASRMVETQQKCWSTEQQKEFIRHFQNVGKDFDHLARLMHKTRKSVIEHYYMVKLRACNETGLKPEPYCRGTRRLRPRNARRSVKSVHTWTCGRCTYKNNSDQECSMCGYKRRVQDSDLPMALPDWNTALPYLDEQSDDPLFKDNESEDIEVTCLSPSTGQSTCSQDHEFVVAESDLITEKAHYFVHRVKQTFDGESSSIKFVDFHNSLQDYKEGTRGVGEVIDRINSLVQSNKELLNEFQTLLRSTGDNSDVYI